ncbi:protein FAM161A [Entelurus aequoreus]|uniref:protein FAM161A n=1 Tax=Entelurus aequoreus TaxID=161455 RepID=UPI002B1E71F6|nr:protein FAM161A [Entelurus aequoreus]
MADAHRNNVLVTSCLRRPVDPHTKAPLASYEREQAASYSATGHVGSRHCEEEVEPEVPGPALYEGDYPRWKGERMDLREIYFSNEEYYSKLEEKKKAHLRNMAELENMYHHKLQLHAGDAAQSVPASRRLRKSHSAAELRRSSGPSDSSDSDEDGVEKGRLFSPKDYIKNMWKDFQLSPRIRHLSSSLPGDHRDLRPQREKRRSHRPTVPKPFRMTLREAERRRRGVKTRSEMELENAELRRQLEELTECQNKFRASPVPAHVHLPLYEELKERDEERRRSTREREQRHLRTLSKPFSFLERERLKKEQRQPAPPAQQDRLKPFKAKPVPRSVYAATSGEWQQEERPHEHVRRSQDGGLAAFSHKPQIIKEVPDFEASFQRFQKNMERRREVKTTTTCEPFTLRTSQMSPPRHRVTAGGEKERSLRWPYLDSPRNSSLCSSLSGSMELLPARITDATKKRHEAVRQVLERRRRAEQEEERRQETQKERQKKIQKLVQTRAHAHDPHLALSQTHAGKLTEFRKQDRQRRKEYRQEIREIKERVKGRPLLLEQVAQKNAKQAAEKRFADTLLGCHLSEDFLSRKAASWRRRRVDDDDTGEQTESDGVPLETVVLDHEDQGVLDHEDQGVLDHEDQGVLDHEDQGVGAEEEEEEKGASRHDSEDEDEHGSRGSCHYSDDYCEDGEEHPSMTAEHDA